MKIYERIRSENVGTTLTIISVGQDPSGLTRAVATLDGGAAIRTAWCECGADPDGSIYYEVLDITGSVCAHGWLCASCRKIVQTG